MNKRNFEEIKDSKKAQIYSLWKNFDFTTELQKTWYRGETYSDNSYSFKIPNIDNRDITKKHTKQIADQLIKIFDIEYKELFEDKLKEVCSGSGNEVRKITTLTSSSLCALLFFYDVKKKPITIKLNNKSIQFNDVMFEFKNKVTENGGPSNMDIVLISGSEKTILFLESKFSEYLFPGQENVRNTYKTEFETEFYNENFLSNIGLSFGKSNNNDYFTIKSKEYKTSVYAAGIKQMISHFIGVRNFSKAKGDLTDSRQLDNSYTIYLGEILFDNFNYDKADSLLESYCDLYSKLINELNTREHTFTLLSSPLKYSDLKNHLNPTIRSFYFGD